MARYRTSYVGERRSVSVRAWMTPIEREALELAATEAGAGLSDYVRQLCIRRLGDARAVAGARRNPAAKLLADELRSVGTTLCRLAESAPGDVARSKELDSTMTLLKSTLAHVIAL